MSVITTEQTPQGIVVRETLVPRKYEATTAALAPTTPFRDPYTILVDENGKLWVWNGTAYVQEAGGAGGSTVDQAARNAAASAANLAALANQKGEEALITANAADDKADQALAAAGATPAAVSTAIAAMTKAQAAPIYQTQKFRNKVLPQFEGAYGDAKSAACTISGSTIAVDRRAHVVTDADVGKTAWFAAEWLAPFPIVSVDVPNNTMTVTGSPPTWAGQIVFGRDDTTVMRAACEWAGSHVYQPQVEDSYGHHGNAPRGGEVVLDSGFCFGVKNTAAEWGAGRTAALYMPRRAAMRGSAGPYSGQIMMLPGSFGDVISNLTNTSFSDFVVLENILIQMMGVEMNESARNGVRWVVPRDAFPKTDAFNRFNFVRVDRAMRDAFYFSGRGELDLNHLSSSNAGECGLKLNGQDDWKGVGGAFGGSGHAGIWIENSGPFRFHGWKSFFNGAMGQADMRLCAGLVVTGDGPHQGHGYMQGEIQEARGACAVIETGGGRYDLECYDPFRQNTQLGADQVTGIGTIDASANKLNKARPSIRSAIVLNGPHAVNNRIECTVSPTVAAWPNIATVNWPAQTSALHVSGDAPFQNANGGAQANTGWVETWQETIKPGGTVERGVEWAGQAKVTGGGATNGKNTRLLVDGVPLT